MKRALICLLALAFTLFISSCIHDAVEPPPGAPSTAMPNPQEPDPNNATGNEPSQYGGQAGETPDGNTGLEGAGNNHKIRLTFEGGEMVVALLDNTAANHFFAMLPMTLSFEDYNGTEKISYLENKLDTAGAPDSFEPSAGDLCYFAPWGNICFFYKDFRLSNGLVPIGSVESGMEFLALLDKTAFVAIERAND